MAHPYSSIRDYQHWIRSLAEVAPDDVDPVTNVKFKINRTDKVATAGSCFAQHISRHLSQAGFNYLVTETPPAAVAQLASKEILATHSYGVFTARYGNLYTTTQLLQLFQRAYGDFEPQEQVWRRKDGRLVDPFRPQIQPGGFHSEDEMLADRRQHLAAVREAFETLDVMVFTLGLTEAFVSTEDGAAFPVAPGVSGGNYDPHRYRFHNFALDEVLRDLREFIRLLRSKNPNCRIILTVSPVPLMATAEDRHVLASTTLSKSVLRVACDMVETDFKDVMYFPSFEIITGNYSRGRYFAADLRSVTEAGVAHVMRLFMKHLADAPTETPAVKPKARDVAAEVEAAAEAVCDEEVLRNI